MMKAFAMEIIFCVIEVTIMQKNTQHPLERDNFVLWYKLKNAIGGGLGDGEACLECGASVWELKVVAMEVEEAQAFLWRRHEERERRLWFWEEP